jgi:type III secretion system FlhB-like substrate exporter
MVIFRTCQSYNSVFNLIDEATTVYKLIKQSFEYEVAIVNDGESLKYLVKITLHESVPKRLH